MASDLERLDRQRREALARAHAAEARLAHVREEYEAWTTEGLGHIDGIENTNWPDAWAAVGAALRGPQDEEAAQVCGAHGCSNRATGMRKSHVPGWADVPDCGMHTQRSGTARPEAAVVCTDCGGTGIAYFETNCKGCSGLVSPAHDRTCGVEPCHCTQRSTQDEEPAEECQHDSECALLYGDGPDAPSECECRHCCPRCDNAQRSGTARPDHPSDTCTDQCETDWHTAECAAGVDTGEDHDAR